eukprot:3532271-Amphidinium_carterae.1
MAQSSRQCSTSEKYELQQAPPSFAAKLVGCNRLDLMGEATLLTEMKMQHVQVLRTISDFISCFPELHAKALPGAGPNLAMRSMGETCASISKTIYSGYQPTQVLMRGPSMQATMPRQGNGQRANTNGD